MPTYFVRLRENHELVGVYSAADLESLKALVDEATDVAGCEQLEAGDGGVYQPDRVSARLPPRIAANPEDGWHPDDRAMWTGAMLTEGWYADLMNEGAEWLPLTDD